MNLKERYNLWLIKRASAPAFNFQKKLWKQLDRKWNEFNITESKKIYIPHWAKLTIASAVAFVVIFTSSVGVYAYTSPNVNPDHPFYPIKIGTEKIVEKFKVSPETKAKFNLAKISRREAEKTTIAKNQIKIQSLDNEIKTLEDKLEHDDALIKPTNQAKANLKERIESRLEQRKVKLENSLEKQQQIETKLDAPTKVQKNNR